MKERYNVSVTPTDEMMLKNSCAITGAWILSLDLRALLNAAYINSRITKIQARNFKLTKSDSTPACCERIVVYKKIYTFQLKLEITPSACTLFINKCLK